MDKRAPRPVMFLDFDHTLFDTDRLREWLGEDIEERVRAIDRDELELPDCSVMLYPDTLPFMKSAREVRRLVLLTSTAYPSYQKKKIVGSGIAPFLDDMLIVMMEEGYLNKARKRTAPRISSGKGEAAREYLGRVTDRAGETVFVDDLAENLSEVKTLLPTIRAIQIERASSRRERLSEGRLIPPDGKVADLNELAALLALPRTTLEEHGTL